MTTIDVLHEASPEAATALGRLASALHGDERVLTEAELQSVIASGAVPVVARDGDEIVGMGTLYIMRKFGNTTAHVEDVIVDEKCRGQGLGEKIMQRLIEEARTVGAASVNLTSRPARVAANKLYQKLGFELRETNVYKLKL